MKEGRRLQITQKLLATLALFGIFEVIALQQAIFYALAIPLILIAIAILAAIIGANIWQRGLLKAKKLILPVILILGTLFFILFEESQALSQLFIFVLCFLVYFFFTFYRNIPGDFKEDTIRIKNYFNFAILFAAFLMFLVGYNLLFIFQISLGLVGIFIVIVGMILFYYQIWIERGKLELNHWLFITLLGLVVAEIFIILGFWPASPWVLSGVMMVIFYMYFGIFNLYLEENLKVKNILEYLLVGGVTFIAIISIIRWYF